MKKKIAIFVFVLMATFSSFAVAQRTAMVGNLSLYVDCISGSDLNSGTALSPFKTRARAYQYDQQNLDHMGQFITTTNVVNYCSSLPETTSVYGPLIGSQGHVSFVFQGSGKWGTRIDAPSGTFAFSAALGAQYQVRGFTIYPGASGGGGFLVDDGVMLIDQIGFVLNNSNSLGNVAGPRSFLMTGNIGIASYGVVNIAFVSENHGQINMGGPLDCAGAPTWTTAFVQGDLGGMIDATGFTYSNCPYATGPRYNAILNGIVFTGSGTAPPVSFPGSSAGAVNSGGIYQ